MTTALPFDDFRQLALNLSPGDDAAERSVRTLFKRRGAEQSLGPVVDLAAWLARWSGRAPVVRRPLVAIFAGNHGLLQHGVTSELIESTAAAVEMCAAGGAAINQVCVAYDLGLKVFDLALDLPTADLSEQAALDERACAATMAFGMEAVAEGADLLCLGDLGAGNDVVAAAMFAALFGGGASDWIALAQGADGAAARGRAVERVDLALTLHRGHLSDPLEVLRRLGGREFAALAGAILAARAERVPVLLDGLPALAAASVLHRINPDAISHCLVAARHSLPGHAQVLANLGMTPVLDMEIGHREAVGAALAAGAIKAAAQIYSGMAVVG